MLLGLYITFLWYVMYHLVFSENKPSARLEASRTLCCVCFLVGLNWDLEERYRNRHHTRWCLARKLYIPRPCCVRSICCSLWISKHRGCYFFYSLVQLNIAESETFSTSGANRCRIVNNFKFLVKYFDARRSGDILSRYLVFLQRFMSCCSLSAEYVVTAASSAQRKLRKCFSRILVLAFNLTRLKNLH